MCEVGRGIFNFGEAVDSLEITEVLLTLSVVYFSIVFVCNLRHIHTALFCLLAERVHVNKIIVIAVVKTIAYRIQR